ncbi:MAG: hypothetical protein RLZZ373_2958, partial [Pseudomonadota bacterium]
MGTLRSVTFNSSGSWTVPDGVTACFVNMIGSGNGGASGRVFSGGGAGGAGSLMLGQPQVVTPGDILSVTIGSGGVGGAPNGDVSLPGGVAGTTAFLQYQQQGRFL